MKHNSPFFTEDFADWLENLPQERWAAISKPLMLITSFYVADRLKEEHAANGAEADPGADLDRQLEQVRRDRGGKPT